VTRGRGDLSITSDETACPKGERLASARRTLSAKPGKQRKIRRMIDHLHMVSSSFPPAFLPFEMSHDHAVTRNYRLLPVFYRHDTRSFLCAFFQWDNCGPGGHHSRPPLSLLFFVGQESKITKSWYQLAAHAIVLDRFWDTFTNLVCRLSFSFQRRKLVAVIYYCENLRNQKIHDLNHRQDPKQ
jgi:hypothetical protein